MSNTINKNLPEIAPETSIDIPQEVITEEVPPHRLKSSVIALIDALRTETLAPLLEKLSRKLGAEWKILDASWTEKYGDRYQQIKQSLQTAKTRYEDEKNKIHAGEPNPIDKKQSEWTIKSGEAGVFFARAEARIKQRLVELWETRHTHG